MAALTQAYSHTRTRSPYFVQMASTESGVTCELYIWTGNVTSIPASPQYTLTKEVVDGAATFEVSELIRDFLSQTSTLSSGTAWWKAIMNDGVASATTFTEVATEGYHTYDSGLQHPGVNTAPQTAALPVDINNNARVFTASGANGIIPVIYNAMTNSTYGYIALNASGDVIATGSPTSSDLSNNQISYITTNIAYDQVHFRFDNENDVINGSFLVDTSNWLAYLSTLTWDASSKARVVTSGSIGAGGLRQNSILEIGTPYKVQFTANSDTVADFEYFNDGAWQSIGFNASAGVDQTFTFYMNATVDYLVIRQLANNATILFDNIVAYPYNDQIVYVDNLRCSEYEPIRLLYVNKYGAKNYMHFGLKSIENINTSSDEYRRSLVNYTALTNGNSLHASRKRITGSKQSFVLNTDWMDEYYVDQMEELLLSEYVWLARPTGNPIPVNVKDSKLTKKTHLNDRLINYTINVETASEYINVVR